MSVPTPSEVPPMSEASDVPEPSTSTIGELFQGAVDAAAAAVGVAPAAPALEREALDANSNVEEGAGDGELVFEAPDAEANNGNPENVYAVGGRRRGRRGSSKKARAAHRKVKGTGARRSVAARKARKVRRKTQRRSRKARQ